jgi:uncharacterized membrane protein YhaH (DUF805 family)
MNWMLLPLKRYADFSGRSQRKEYWMFTLGMIIAEIVIMVVEGILGINRMVGGIYGPILTLFFLAIFVPSLAVSIRRLHDTDKSGWFLLLGLIPFVGAIILLVFFCTDGTSGANRFGSDPKASDGNLGDVFA